MASKSVKMGSQQPPTLQLSKVGPFSTTGGKTNATPKPKTQSDGHPKHTQETCFKLHGYPEWWHELKGRNKMHEVPMANLDELL